MLGKKTLQARFPAFQSPKTVTPIPVRHSSVQDALIQSSLDPRVRSIGYVASAVVAGQQVNLGAIVVQRDDGRFFLDLVPVPARRVLDLDQLGLVLIALETLRLKPWTIDVGELLREPRCSNARFVWLYNGHPVAREQRKRILEAVADKQPIRLGQLERTVRSRRGDPFASIMALACASLVELDLVSQPIMRTTIVRAR
jgi:hypothetical protein